MKDIMENTLKIILVNILLLINISFVLPTVAAQKSKQGVKTFNIVLPKDATSVLKNIASIMERQIIQRCDAHSIDGDSAELQIMLLIDQKIKSETFRIEDAKTSVIRIIGGDEKGVLFGVGKFLRSSRYDLDGFVAGEWRGSSTPDSPVRAVYLATHFNNFYEAAPIEEVVQYIQDLGLWGYNTIIVHYPTWQYEDAQDKAAQKWFNRFKTVFTNAKECGLNIGLIQCVNQGYKSTPAELLGTTVPGHRRGNHGVNLCPNKPKARELLLSLYSDLLENYKDIGLDYFIFWPYDEGGCACNECWPWGAEGYIEISREMEKLVKNSFPESKIILSTWCFENEDDKNPDGEWVGLEKSLKQDNSWVDYIMADGHNNYFPKYLLEQGIPGNLPLLNFPEISMFGMSPWGGYGTNSAPEHFQLLWDRIKYKTSGGAPYSEGIYEDINKAIIANFYWDRESKAKDAVREYISFEFSPDVTEDMLEVVRIFEQNHDRKNIQNNGVRAFDLVNKAKVHLTKEVQKSWRWRIFYLRALIDKELYLKNGKLEGESLKAAFAELTKLYYAEDAHSMPIKPPVIK